MIQNVSAAKPTWATTRPQAKPRRFGKATPAELGSPVGPGRGAGALKARSALTSRLRSALIGTVILLLGVSANFGTPTTASATSVSWQLQPGRAKDVAVGANGEVWVVGNNPVQGGYGIYHLVNGSWKPMPGGAVRIAVGPTGQPWVVNDKDQIFTWVDSSIFTWIESSYWRIVTTEGAKDIAVAADGNVYIVSTTPKSGGYAIKRYILPGNIGEGWRDIGVGAPGALRIAAGNNLWIVDDRDRIFRADSGGWVRLPGAAKDVGVNRDQTWVIGTTPVAGGRTIHRFNGFGWDWVAGGADAISVDPSGRPWVVNAYGEIFRGSVL